MTISTMHTICTWLVNTTRDTGYELVLSHPPLPPSQAHTVFTCTRLKKAHSHNHNYVSQTKASIQSPFGNWGQ